jgi:hypothetical protein
LIFLVLLGLLALPAFAAPRTRNVIVVMTDGLRWQEVFQGADAALMNKENGAVSEPEALKKEFWRDTPTARREALMPFLWTTIAKQGQVFGNRTAGSEAWVTNGMNFSYPGYSETLCGFPDPRIDSNDKVPNPNVTLFEWLHQKPAFKGKVAAFGAWDVFPFIFNAPRAGFLVNAGNDPYTVAPVSREMALMNRLKKESAIWESEALDTFTFHTSMEYLKKHQPRVMYLSLGETDEWAHAGKYADYLRATKLVDSYLRELWQTLQSISKYRGNTTVVFLPDHGRGEAPVEWKSHGQKIPDSKYIWMAFLGPDTAPLGERTKTAPVTQSQIAATVAALLGEDYTAAVPKAGKPITDVLPRQ